MISNVTDTLIDNNTIRRKYGNHEKVIEKDRIIHSKQDIKLIPIETPKVNKGFISNPNIGAIDLEMFKDDDGISKVYAGGFMTNSHTSPTTIYIDKQTLDSSNIVLCLINELLRPKYADVTFYCHNLGGYDVIYIIKVLNDYNESERIIRNIKCRLF